MLLCGRHLHHSSVGHPIRATPPLRRVVFTRRATDGLLWSLGGVCLAGVVLLSLTWESPIESLLLERAGHLVAYAAVTGSFLLAAVWRPGRGTGRWPRAVTSIVLGGVALGALFEGVQALIGRDPDLIDLAADAAGAGLGWVIWVVLRWIFGPG